MWEHLDYNQHSIHALYNDTKHCNVGQHPFNITLHHSIIQCYIAGASSSWNVSWGGTRFSCTTADAPHCHRSRGYSQQKIIHDLYSCSMMSELHIFRVMSGSVTMLLSSRIQTALHRSVSRFPMKLPGTQIFRKCSSLHFQKINRCLNEFQEVATLESLADKSIQRRWLPETSTPSSTSTLSSNVTEVGSTYSPPPPPHPPPPLTAACPLMGTSISKLRRGSLIKAAHP